MSVLPESAIIPPLESCTRNERVHPSYHPDTMQLLNPTDDIPPLLIPISHPCRVSSETLAPPRCVASELVRCAQIVAKSVLDSLFLAIAAPP